MKTEAVIEQERQCFLQVFKRPPFVLERGNGVYLFDLDAKRYLDFVSGIGVNAFGYGDRDMVQAITDQAHQLIHCSNLYYSVPSVMLAKQLVDHSFADKAFLQNSGSEAVEAAIKFARKWGSSKHTPARYEIITMTGSFHGRTYGALSATGQGKYHKGFEPMLPGFRTVAFGDLEAARGAITDRTCAVMIEPLQGEGGAHLAPKEYLQGLRTLCDERGLLLIFDEVQCGLGRLGSLFAYEHFDVVPDMVTLAKPLGGGLPIGAILLKDEVAQCLGPSDHGTTFGGNPVACALALKVLEKLLAPGFLEEVRHKGDRLHQQLGKLAKHHPEEILEIRGGGLLAGVVTKREPKLFVEAFLERGILVAVTGSDAVRLIPPYIIKMRHIDSLIDAFHDILEHMGSERGS